jgi:hypothetical protein
MERGNHLAEGGPGILNQASARLRQRNAAGRAHEENDLKLRFELLNSLADGGSRYPQFACRAAEAAVPGDGQK